MKEGRDRRRWCYGGTTSSVVTQAALKAIADPLRDRYGAERVLVYGSVARGTPTEHIDIDLLVVAPTTERFFERMGSALAVVRDISRGLPLAPIILTQEELDLRLQRCDHFIQDILDTGVDL